MKYEFHPAALQEYAIDRYFKNKTDRKALRSKLGHGAGFSILVMGSVRRAQIELHPSVQSLNIN
jgi:hypothetical protein